VSFSSAKARLDEESRPGDGSGFFASRRAMPGSGHLAYILALRLPGSPSYAIVRPNTGTGFIDMEASELHQKYGPCTLDDAQEAWQEAYERSLHQCSHGMHCQAGPTCHVGRRLTTVTILSGSVVRIWDSLDRTLSLHETELSKADRALRIVRVESAGEMPGLPLIGVRFPGHLLGEVVVDLSALELQKQNQKQSEGIGRVRAKGGHEVGGDSLAASFRKETPAPVDPRAMRKAFSAPKTLLSFFQHKTPIVHHHNSPPPPTKDRQNPFISSVGAPLPVSGKKRPASETGELVDLTDGMSDVVDTKSGETLSSEYRKGGDVDALRALGFSHEQVARALKVAGGSVELAANWLFAQ